MRQNDLEDQNDHFVALHFDLLDRLVSLQFDLLGNLISLHFDLQGHFVALHFDLQGHLVYLIEYRVEDYCRKKIQGSKLKDELDEVHYFYFLLTSLNTYIRLSSIIQ
ncbi:hypothetical protein MOSE0_B05644 [Monosporozyma servazzii]